MGVTNLHYRQYSEREKDCIKTMIAILNNHGISKTDYSVNGYADDKLCLEKDASRWLIYNVDRGERFDLQRYSSIYLACLSMISKLSESEELEAAMMKEMGYKTPRYAALTSHYSIMAKYKLNAIKKRRASKLKETKKLRGIL